MWRNKEIKPESTLLACELEDTLLSSAYTGVGNYEERAEMAEPLQIIPSISEQLILKTT